MTKRLVPLFFLLAACSSGATDDSPSSFSASFGGDAEAEAEAEADTGDGDGDEQDDGDGDPTTTTGDGDPTTTGDGDGDPTTTGDGDGDGDGDVDPCPLICDGKPDSTPNTCDAPYVIGRTQAKTGFFYGGSTLGATDDDNGACGPADVSNYDSGRDHFFRIYLVIGDTVTAVQNPNGWNARLKIHDEAECIGKAKECSSTADPADIVEYEALKSDWYTIVADGQVYGYEDWGDYTLTVDLVEGGGVDECGCP